MRSKLNSSFRLRLTFMVLLAILIPVAGTLFYATVLGVQSIQDNVANTLEAQADSLTNAVTAWDNTVILAVQNLSRQPDMLTMNAARQRPTLESMATIYTDMYLIQTVDTNGDNIARSDGEELINYADREWFQGSMAGNEISLQTLIGRSSGQPALTYSAPIWRNDEIVGATLAATDLDTLAEAVGAIQVGETGFGYLVDADGVVLAHPDPAYTAGELVNISTFPPVARALANEQGALTFTDDDGVIWLAHTQPLANGWGIVVQQQRAEAMAALPQFIALALVISTAVMAVIGVLTWWVAGRAVRPIITLTGAATAVAGGNLEETVEIKQTDEIGVLATAFNSMTLQLRDLVQNLENRVADRTRDLSLASDVGRNVSTIRDVDDLLKQAVHIIQNYFNLYYVQIYLVNSEGNTLNLKAAEGHAAERLLKQGHFLNIDAFSINGTAALAKRPVLVPFTYDNPLFRPNPLLPDTRSEMAVPLIYADQVLGVLSLQSTEPYAFSEENLPAFESLAGQLAVAMENAALFTERDDTSRALQEALIQTEQQAARFASLNELSTAFTSASSPNEIFQLTGSRILSLVDGDRASITLITEAGDSFEVLVLEDDTGAIQTGTIMPLAGTAVGLAINEQRIVRLPKEAPLSTYADSRLLAQQGLQSLLVAPLTASDQHIGALNVGSKMPYAFTDADVTFIQQIATLVSTNVESMRLITRVQNLANIVENHQDFIGISTLEGQMRYINPAGLALLGLPEGSDITGLNAADLYAPEDAERFRQEGIDQIFKTGFWITEATAQKQDGSTIPIKQTITISYDDNNNPVGMSISLRDITERQNLLEEQRHMTARFEERLLQVNALQRAMTHEGWSAFLTSPNRLIQGFKFNNDQIGLISTRDVQQRRVPVITEWDGAEDSQPDPASTAVPVKVRGETIGVIGAHTSDGTALSAEQVEMVNALTQQVADALDRARLFEEMEMAREQMNALYIGSERVVQAQSIDEVLLALVESTELKKMDSANFMYFDKPWGNTAPETMTITAVWSKKPDSSLEKVGAMYEIAQFPSLHNISKTEPTLFFDVAADERAGPDAKMLAKLLGVNCVLYVPLVVAGQWFGLLSAKAVNAVKFSDDEIKQITSLVDQSATVSQTQRLFAQSQARARREQLLREVGARVYAAPDAESILKTAAKEVNRILGVDSFVYLDKPGGSEEITAKPENGRQPILENGVVQEG
jgi:PAS domain S-box-containing protein